MLSRALAYRGGAPIPPDHAAGLLGWRRQAAVREPGRRMVVSRMTLSRVDRILVGSGLQPDGRARQVGGGARAGCGGRGRGARQALRSSVHNHSNIEYFVVGLICYFCSFLFTFVMCITNQSCHFCCFIGNMGTYISK